MFSKCGLKATYSKVKANMHELLNFHMGKLRSPKGINLELIECKVMAKMSHSLSHENLSSEQHLWIDLH